MLGLPAIHNFGVSWQKGSGGDAGGMSTKSFGADGRQAGASRGGASSDSAGPPPQVISAGWWLAARRLRHVSQVAVRGLDFEAATTAGGGYHLELVVSEPAERQAPPSRASEAAASVLERSDLLSTRNPTWAPVCGVRQGRDLTACVVRAVDARDGAVCWSAPVSLPELVPLCSELEDLPAAPLGVPLVRLGTKWHVAQAALPIGATLPPEQQRRRLPMVKHIQASQICGAGKDISAMLSRLRSLQTQSAALRQAMEASLSEGQELHSRRARHAACERRVLQLRTEVEERRQRVAQLRESLERSNSEHSDHAEQLAQRDRRLEQSREEQRKAEESLPGVHSSLRTLWLQVRCRQIRMLYEVCQVYPIQNCGRYWTIRGLSIASIDTLCRQDLREEQNISTALGFLAHLMVTLASILEVPLRISVHNAGCSRCHLIDPHEARDPTAGPREWPLYYGRGLEKSRFERALRLLHDGLLQFLYSRGYFDARYSRGAASGAGNLLECAELILRKEMYDGGD